MMDTLTGTFFAAVAWLLLPKHKSFIGYRVDLSCGTEAVTQVIMTYTEHTSSRETEIDRDEDVPSCFKVSVYKM